MGKKLPKCRKIGRYGFSGKRMHVFWDNDMPAKIGPEELLKGGCENAASYWSAGTGTN